MLHTAAVNRLLSLTASEGDAVLKDMEQRAEREGFPTIGSEVGAALRLYARLLGATSVFEFGSGFGYSAYWVAPVLGADGQIVLTEVDEDELTAARTYFERGGYTDRAVFEEGDALAVIERYDGPFDMVLLDHKNDRYVDGFEAVREKVAPGGVVVADNVLHSSGEAGFTPAELEAVFDGTAVPSEESSLASITEYYRHVRADPDFETTVVPVGEGLFVSVRR